VRASQPESTAFNLHHFTKRTFVPSCGQRSACNAFGSPYAGFHISPAFSRNHDRNQSGAGIIGTLQFFRRFNSDPGASFFEPPCLKTFKAWTAASLLYREICSVSGAIFAVWCYSSRFLFLSLHSLHSSRYSKPAWPYVVCKTYCSADGFVRLFDLSDSHCRRPGAGTENAENATGNSRAVASLC